MEARDKYILIGFILGLLLLGYIFMAKITAKPQVVNPNYDYKNAVCLAPKPAPNERACTQ